MTLLLASLYVKKRINKNLNYFCIENELRGKEIHAILVIHQIMTGTLEEKKICLAVFIPVFFRVCVLIAKSLLILDLSVCCCPCNSLRGVHDVEEPVTLVTILLSSYMLGFTTSATNYSYFADEFVKVCRGMRFL